MVNVFLCDNFYKWPISLKMFEHHREESKGLRFNSSWEELKIFSLSHIQDMKKKTSFSVNGSICPSHTLEIFQMKNSFGSSPVESTTSNSGPKSQNAQLNTPCTPALINWKEMAVLLTVVYFYSQTNQVLYKVCNWLQCWQEKRNFKQKYFHRNCISFIHFKCSWNDAMQHHII